MNPREPFMPKKLLQTVLTVAIAAGFLGMGITIVNAESAIWIGDTVGYRVGPITVTRPPHWACHDSDEKLIYFDGRQANVATEDQARTAKPEQVWCDKEQRILFACLHKAYSLINSAVLIRSHPLSPVDVFQKGSPSVFVVEALDENGKTRVLGSAVAIFRDVLITNCHVVENGYSLRLRRGTGNWTAKLIEAAPNHDLCGLRPSGLTLQAVEVRPSSKLAIGERVYAIGSPEGLELTFSEGVISSLRDTEGVHMIQTSAPISPGSSGGGLFDTQGNLIGITTFQLKEGQSLNFALPGEWIRSSLDSLTEVSHKSSSKQSDAELESKAWLAIGLEAKEKEDYELAVSSFRKCADLKQTDAPKAWLELGEIDEGARDRVIFEILQYASATDAIRTAAWDAFHAAVDGDDFNSRFDVIPLPNEVKTELRDLKFGSRKPPTGAAICRTVNADGRVVYSTNCH
jgi:S1-C subfamily serine protease